MNKYAKSVTLLAGSCLLMISTSCGPSPVKDFTGRELPAVGRETQIIGPQGWLARDESAFAELANTGVRVLDLSPAEAQSQIKSALETNAKRLMQEGKVMEVKRGARVRVLGYYGGTASNIRPMSATDTSAEFVKVEVLDGEAKQRAGFTTADAVK